MQPRRFALIAAVGLVASMLGGELPVRAGVAADLLPDLRMEPLSDIKITVEGGHRLLRFGAIMSNRGAGPLEVHATRPSSAAGWTVNQVIFDDMGGSRERSTDTTMVFAGDGHDHWHVRDMMYYDLWGPGGTYRESKIGFCFLDSTPIALSLPGAPQSSHYHESACDGLTTTNIRVGISVGWGDNYPWNFAYQWVDITGISPGTYMLRSIMDPLDHFTELDEANNCTWTRLSIPTSGNPTILGSGQTCVDDIESSPFANDIHWLYAAGITTGCRVMLFCTTDPVTRGQMAALIDRAMNLPATAVDFFTDDGASIFEMDINRLAAAGITKGCTSTTYCPDATITREQMAAFLDRALSPPATATDYFTDDESSAFEASINRVAAAGITKGCSATTYCPTAVVTRGQMAAFLHRTFGP